MCNGRRPCGFRRCVRIRARRRACRPNRESGDGRREPGAAMSPRFYAKRESAVRTYNVYAIRSERGCRAFKQPRPPVRPVLVGSSAGILSLLCGPSSRSHRGINSPGNRRDAFRQMNRANRCIEPIKNDLPTRKKKETKSERERERERERIREKSFTTVEKGLIIARIMEFLRTDREPRTTTT